MVKKLLALPLLALAAGAILVALTQGGGNTETTQAVALSGVSSDALKRGGMELFATAKVVQSDKIDTARQDATARFGPVKETAVARVVSPNFLLDNVFIIANIDVTGMTSGGVPPGSPSELANRPAGYMLVFFDPEDGSFVQAITVGKEPPGSP